MTMAGAGNKRRHDPLVVASAAMKTDQNLRPCASDPHSFDRPRPWQNAGRDRFSSPTRSPAFALAIVRCGL